MSLSDACFDLKFRLQKRDAPPHVLVQTFLESVRHYASPPWGYDKHVTDKLLELAEAYLQSRRAKNLQALRVAAETTRGFLDGIAFFPETKLVVENGILVIKPPILQILKARERRIRKAIKELEK
jgi:hypothetical protein